MADEDNNILDDLMDKVAPVPATPVPLSTDVIASTRERALNDLYFFAKGILGFDWLTPHIHLPLCERLEAYEENTRLEITLPRGWLKTTLCSQAYPMWRACRDPNVRILLVQNTSTNAVSKLSVIKNAFETNPVLRAIFPDVLPTPQNTWKSDSLCLNRSRSMSESTFEAAGVRTQVTSRHYDLIIEDDTVAPDFDDLGQENLCPTKDDISQAIGWHRLVPPLLINPSKSQNLVVGTRWFEKDLISWIHDHEDYFCFYERACREDENGLPDEHGKVTYQERFDEKTLLQLAKSMGPYMFSCLYLNKPLRSDDMIFRQEWFQYYETLPRDLITYTTVDLGGDPEETMGEADYNVVMTCGKDLHKGRIYVIEYTREKCSPGELLDILFGHVRRHHPVKVGVETVAYQKSILYWMKEKKRAENLYFVIEPLRHTTRSKNMRIMGLQPVIASGTLLFRTHHLPLISELLTFPLGVHDDLADTLAMQLELWSQTVSIDEEKEEKWSNDPLNVDCAIREFEKERDKRKEGLVSVLDIDNPILTF